jgi:tRNA pseudouridine38-40 synthase
MVRIIAGTLMRVGKGEIKPGDIPGIIEAKDRGAAGPTAPACGLTMMGIEYDD